jgi:hypothetical protein
MSIIPSGEVLTLAPEHLTSGGLISRGKDDRILLVSLHQER